MDKDEIDLYNYYCNFLEERNDINDDKKENDDTTLSEFLMKNNENLINSSNLLDMEEDNFLNLIHENIDNHINAGSVNDENEISIIVNDDDMKNIKNNNIENIENIDKELKKRKYKKKSLNYKKKKLMESLQNEICQSTSSSITQPSLSLLSNESLNIVKKDNNNHVELLNNIIENNNKLKDLVMNSPVLTKKTEIEINSRYQTSNSFTNELNEIIKTIKKNKCRINKINKLSKPLQSTNCIAIGNCFDFLYNNGYQYFDNFFKKEDIITCKEQLLYWINKNLNDYNGNEINVYCNDAYFNDVGISHEEFLWDLRKNEKLVSTFCNIWNEIKKIYKPINGKQEDDELFINEDMIPSFEGIYVINKFNFENGFHHFIRKQPVNVKNFSSYQALIPLDDFLCSQPMIYVRSKSHLYSDAFYEQFKYVSNISQDYFDTYFNANQCEIKSMRTKQGSLLIMDNRIVTSFSNNLSLNCLSDELDINRFIFSVCFIPKQYFKEEEIFKLRFKAWQNGISSYFDPRINIFYPSQYKKKFKRIVKRIDKIDWSELKMIGL